MSEDENRGGYTSVTLGDILPKIDQQSEEIGIRNRSQMIRMILKKYYDLKDRGVDLLKKDDDEIIKKVKK